MGGLPGIREKIDDQTGIDALAVAKRIQGWLIEWGQRHVAPGRDD
jgi:hypothetical protein